MGTPKKPSKKKPDSKSAGAKKAAPGSVDPKAKKRIIDDEDDEDFDMPLDEIGGYESFEEFDEDDDF
ncbi:hypothetical protein [Mucilaginibacter sp. L196]|uniref:hypothetical protein n=1 Tax=Mucilaginibacter sp. L196 TaxID=1641870 RepID=UPI00131CC3C7|nr:hypothetical protein [Mucilaginibacter sp. L196]